MYSILCLWSSIGPTCIIDCVTQALLQNWQTVDQKQLTDVTCPLLWLQRCVVATACTAGASSSDVSATAVGTVHNVTLRIASRTVTVKVNATTAHVNVYLVSTDASVR